LVNIKFCYEVVRENNNRAYSSSSFKSVVAILISGLRRKIKVVVAGVREGFIQHKLDVVRPHKYFKESAVQI
jgi:hypothetical protein